MLGSASLAQAATELPPGPAEVNLLEHAAYFTSNANAIHPDDLFAHPDQYSLTPANGRLSLGYTQQDVWLHITLNAPQSQAYRLIIKPPFLDQVDVYQQTPQGERLTMRSGDHVAIANRPLPSRYSVFPITLNQGQNQFWIRIQSTSAMTASVWLKSVEQHIAEETSELVFFGALFGLLAMALLVSLLSAFWTKDILFVYSSTYLFFFAVVNVTLTGFDQLYWYPSMPMVAAQVMGIASGAIVIALTLFMNQYLQLHDYQPRLFKLLLAHMVLAATVMVASVMGFYPLLAPYFMWLSLSVLGLLFFSVLAMLRHKPMPAMLMMMTFLPSIVAVFLQALRNLGVLPTNFWTSNLWALSAFLQVTFVVLVILVQLKQQQQEAAAQHQQSKALRHFLDLMAHELRTPLAVLSSAITNIEIRTTISDDMTARFARAHNALARLNNLVDNALAESRLSTNSSQIAFERIDLPSFVDNVLELVTVSAKHQIRCALQGSETTCTGNKQMLSLALLNLLDNAVKYSPDGGAIELTVEAKPNQVAFAVSDQGIGVPQAEQHKLFTKFFRASNATHAQGLGMGLYLVAQVAELHHGTLSYEALRQGSRITLHIANQP